MVVREVLMTASRNELMRTAATTNPFAQGVVSRFVAGETVDDAVRVANELSAAGLHCTIDHLGEDTTDLDLAADNTATYIELLEALSAADLTDRAEVSVKLGAIGQSLDEGARVMNANLKLICEAAAAHDTTVTIDAEANEYVGEMVHAVKQSQKEFPWLGIALQSYLRRTHSDVKKFTGEGSRVRLCKGAYVESSDVAFGSSSEIDLSFVRCLKTLMYGDGYPMVATHDPRLIEITAALAVRADRERGSYEYQMLYGVRPEEQRRLASLGERVRVYVPYGTSWYPYLVRRMAENPANLGLFVRALTSRR